MKLRVVAPLAALGGGALAAAVLWATSTSPAPVAVMPPASPAVSASGAGVPQDGVSPEGPPAADLPRSRVVAGEGGSRTGAEGIPVGFARTDDGAAAAATAWLSAVEGSAGVDSTRRPAMLAAIGDGAFVSGAGSRLADRAAALGLDKTGQPPGDGVLLATVWATRGAYRVSATSKDAEVTVWYFYQLGVSAAGGTAPAGTWRRATVSLRWDDKASDWRVAGDFRFADGPTPGGPPGLVPSIPERAALLAGVGKDWQLYANTQG